MVTIDRSALISTFQLESEELLSELERFALDLDERLDDVALVGEMFRIAHTLKGGASCVGFERVVMQAHELEAVFESITTRKRTANRDLTTVILDAIDLLRSGVRASPESAADPVAGEERTLQRIRNWLAAGDVGKSDDTNRQSNDTAPSNQRRTLRVDVERLDALLNLVGEVAIAEGRLRSIVNLKPNSAAAETWQNFSGLFQTLQDNVMRLRLVPLGPTLDRFRRAVRDLSHGAGKLAELAVEGGDVEVDVTLAEALRDPLMHMVRNAIDHGIESPPQRREAGKDPVGRITLRARHDGNYVVVEVVDDGAGINLVRLVERAQALGINVPSGDSATLTELAFAPGVSTADTVTSLSGRGIGMDVVRRDIEALRGSISLNSIPGSGFTASIRVPLTVAIIQGFGVRVGDETYIVPVDSIQECIDLDGDHAMFSERGGVLELRGKPLPFVDLALQLNTKRDVSRARQVIVVLEHGTQRVGLGVDSLIGEVQTVIKPLGPLFSSVRHVAGTAVLSNGQVALVLDVGRLLRAVA